MATSTSLNLRALLKTAVTRSGMDLRAQALSGLTPPAKALYVAAVAQAMPHGAVLYIVPGDGELEQTVGDVRFFLAALEGLSDSTAEQVVLPFQSNEVDPYRGMAPHFGVTSARARALHALASGTARVVVASAPALLPLVSSPERIFDASIELKPGHDIAPADLAERLVDAGFSREDPADEHGEFALRGGILDIFPAGEAQPVRLEFVGDTIESMRRYDPGTQRSTTAVDQLVVVPLRDVLPAAGREAGNVGVGIRDWGLGIGGVPQSLSESDSSRSQRDNTTPLIPNPQSLIPTLDRSATIFDFLASMRESRVVLSEADEIEANALKLVEQVRRSYEEHAGLAGPVEEDEATREILAEWEADSDEDAEAHRTAEDAEGAEGSRHRHTARAHRTAEDAEGAEGTNRSHLRGKADPNRARGAAARRIAARREQRDLPTPETLFAGWDEVAARLSHATTLSQLGIDNDEGAEGVRTAEDAEDAEDAESARHNRAARAHRTAELAGLHQSPIPNPQSLVRPVRCQPTVELHGRLQDWVSDIKRTRDEEGITLFVAATAGRAERTIELLKDYEIFAVPVERAEDARYAAVLVATGALSRGFRLPDAGLQIYAEWDVFEEERRTPERRRSASNAFLSDLRDLKVGDLVVHVEHGIGVFVGLEQIGLGPQAASGASDSVQEFLELRYAGEDKLFVPVERLDLVQKYTGASRPPIDRLGGASWERAKTKVRKAMRDMAEELLELYARRKAVPGHAFSADSHWQQEFEDAFPYELTPDQKTAIADIKRDMESTTPMDRLLCGDVGYGKTEVAMRAAFKAVMDGKQVAFLAPTTVLAFQHEKTLRERFAGFPVRIEMISRFRNKQEQKQAVADLAAGRIDVIVGTHRLLSKDVEFRDLGLLVVDEEQRFGVAHKEKIKQLRKKVDVLTMSATPIPRTLNMSLVGIRDMSIIETPPKDRLSIQTNVVKFDPEVIRRAVRNEIERGGQIYFVHNRVESIFSIGNLIQRLVPEARVVVGHGQMADDQLERAMLDFVARKFDVLLATTIVENGLDIPNANTIVINRADRYGLSQLYQLRGRVGRSDRPAYAFLLIPPEDNLSPVAKKRLAAIKEFSDLGSGFRVAALDLEIRGAGNLLGGEQSGQIETVGFEMYMKLLEQTVRELKGEDIEDDARATVNLRVDLKIDEAYVADMNQRLMLYRKVAAARHEDEIDRVLEEAQDRYGPLPESVLNLADYGRIRVMADRLGIESIDREAKTVVLKFRGTTRLDPQRLLAVVRGRPELTLIPPAGLRLSLEGAGIRDWGLGISGGGPAKPAGPAGQGGQNSAGQRGATNPQSPIPNPYKRSGRYANAAPSWWTARARESEIKPGFSKEEILRPAKDDPRALGGVFERVGGLLSELVDRS